MIVYGRFELIASSWQDFIDCVPDPQRSAADNSLGSWNGSAAKNERTLSVPRILT